MSFQRRLAQVESFAHPDAWCFVELGCRGWDDRIAFLEFFRFAVWLCQCANVAWCMIVTGRGYDCESSSCQKLFSFPCSIGLVQTMDLYILEDATLFRVARSQRADSWPTLSQAHNPGEELFTTYGARHIQSSFFRKCRRGALVCCKRSNMLLYRTYGQGLAGQADSRPNWSRHIFFGLKPAALQVLHFIQSTSQALRAALFQRLNLLFLYDLCSGASRFIGEVHHTTTFGLELAGNW